jgi:DNA-directed RNA polymerase sigma subunit (sigma70/sigma32)
MTRDRRFKQTVRKRMRATGQNYLSARASLQPHEPADGGEEAGRMASSTDAARDGLRYEVVKRGERDLVDAYLQEVDKFPPLTDAEATRLARDKEAGEYADWYRDDWSKLSAAEIKKANEVVNKGRQARRRLTEANLALVVDMARRYQGQGLPAITLIEEGNRGLVRAVDKFDGTSEQLERSPQRAIAGGHGREDSNFATFATWWILAAIHRALDLAQHARIPTSGEARNNPDVQKPHGFLQELPGRPGHQPTVEEVAKEIGFIPERARSYVSSMLAKLDLDPNENDNERAEQLRQAIESHEKRG